LQSLDLSSNEFQGNLSGGIFANCEKLQYLNVSGNHLEGSVPPQLWSCRSVEEIQLRDNNFTGDLMVRGMGQLPLTKLQKLDLSLNGFTGNLSDVMDAIGCSALAYLDLSFNEFSGAIPAALGNCTQLSYVNVQSNSLTGALPSELGQLQELQWLGVSENSITGTVPESFVQCRRLSVINLSLNLLSGAIPRWVSEIPNLRYFVAHSNNFSGQIPLELAQAPALVHLDVGNNSLSGEIPPQLANLTALRYLRLARNHLVGSVPGTFGDLTALAGLDLSVNQLSGPLPSSLGNLQSLLWLQLAENQLTGPIPPEMTKCRSLLWLNLRNNLLSGPIPRDFFSLGLDASTTFAAIREANDFPPIDIGECSLALSWIPGEDPPFENMAKNLKQELCRSQWLELLDGKKISLAYWQLSNNSFTGSIPVPDVSQTSNLTCILLSYNNLSGAIPENFSRVPFYNIDLRYNYISGSVPDIFEWLAPTLQSLQLSFNNLSGVLPSSLNKLSFLWTYNFSYNPDLAGPVPDNASFRNFDPSAWVNDPNLCRIPDATQIPGPQEMRSCNASSSGLMPDLFAGRSGFSNHLVLACTLIGVFGAILLFLIGGSVFLLFLRCRKLHTMRRKQAAVFMDNDDCQVYDASSPVKYVPVNSFGGCLQALTYSDLLKATENFSSAKIIGDGGFGMVYKAKLADGTAVAIKKLVQDGAQGEREFRAEMETLGLIQHPNLVPLLGYCCRSRERLLVYKCLSNGSLDDWLYESEERAASLTWPLRLRIAAGTAQGLAFLHHQCKPLIIHRDMKTSNILLDEHFESCLTDFGLARLMELHMSHVSTVVAGTPGYVAPEYGETWRATAKGDVYSFGVVMLELASGKRPIGPEFHCMEGGNLVAWVKTLTKANRYMEVYDPIVARTGDAESLGRFLTLAVSCTSTEARQRPTMLEVTEQLEELKARQQLLTLPDTKDDS
jgi:Leucine-rich repeat (LRR) protein